MPSWKKVIVSGSDALLNNITASGNVSGSATSTASFGTYIGDGSQLDGVNAFPFSGDAQITGSLIISASNNTSQSLEVLGSGSTIFSVQGSQGQLFSVTDDLLHDNLVVNDISGDVIFKVSGSGLVTIPVGDLSGSAAATASYGHFIGDGSEVTGVISSSYALTASHALNASTPTLQEVTDQGATTTNDIQITGSLIVSSSVVDFTGATTISGSTFSGSFVGDGSGLTGIEIFPLTASSAAIISRSIASGDTDSTALRLFGSGSISESGIFEVEGSAGPLFSVADGLDGVLMEVNNISGLPLFQVSSSNEVFVNRGNLTSGVTTATASFAMFSGSFQGNGSQLTNLNVDASNITTAFTNITSSNNISASGQIIGTGLTASALTAGEVVFVGTGGALASDAGMTYNTANTQLTVTNLNVVHLTSSFITSSTIRTSGSNIFGDDTTDTQTLIGTTKMTGSAEVTGSLTGTPGTTNNLTASYAITASHALSSLTAPTATTASFALTSSLAVKEDTTLKHSNVRNINFTGNAVTLVTPVPNNNDEVSVTIETGSAFPFSGSAEITGSLEVFGPFVPNGINKLTVNNVVIGRAAGENLSISTTAGIDNTLLGAEAGNDLTNGNNNVLIGYKAGEYLTTSQDVIAIGKNAIGADNTAGNALNYVIAIGSSAGGRLQGGDGTGDDNYGIYIGRNAGGNIDSNDGNGNNILIGHRNVGPSSQGHFGEGHLRIGQGTDSNAVIFPISASLTTGSVLIPQLKIDSVNTANSASGTTLSVEGSGSTVFEVIGSEGTLFSIDDDLDGVIFTANDRSGLPVLEASASGEVYIGKAPQSLYTTAVISNTTSSVTQSISGLSTSSYGGAFFDYTVQSGSNARAGSIMSVWNGGNISFTETTTTDIGDTTDFNVIVHISESQAQIASHASRAGYNIKTIIRSI